MLLQCNRWNHRATFASFLCLDFCLLWAPSPSNLPFLFPVDNEWLSFIVVIIAIFLFTSMYPLTIFLSFSLPICIWLFSLTLVHLFVPAFISQSHSFCLCLPLLFIQLHFLFSLSPFSFLVFLHFSATFFLPNPSALLSFFCSSSLSLSPCLSLLLLLLSLLTFFPPPPSQPLSAFFSLVDQTVEAAKLPEARADRGAALSDLPPSPERQTNADTPISCKETIIHHLYQLAVFLS